MLCDRDAVPQSASVEALEETGKGRLRVLKSYHLENYFLDENVIAGIFSIMEPEDSWLRNPKQIRAMLREIATTMISYTAALIVSANYRILVGNLDIMPKACHDKSPEELIKQINERINSEKARINSTINEVDIATSVKLIVEKLQHSLEEDTDEWKHMIPGKQLFNRFASKTGIDSGRLKTLYLREAEKHAPYPFADILSKYSDRFTVMYFSKEPLVLLGSGAKS